VIKATNDNPTPGGRVQLQLNMRGATVRELQGNEVTGVQHEQSAWLPTNHRLGPGFFQILKTTGSHFPTGGRYTECGNEWGSDMCEQGEVPILASFLMFGLRGPRAQGPEPNSFAEAVIG